MTMKSIQYNNEKAGQDLVMKRWFTAGLAEQPQAKLRLRDCSSNMDQSTDEKRSSLPVVSNCATINDKANSLIAFH